MFSTLEQVLGRILFAMPELPRLSMSILIPSPGLVPRCLLDSKKPLMLNLSGGLFNGGVTTSILHHKVARFYVLFSPRHVVETPRLNRPLMKRRDVQQHQLSCHSADDSLNLGQGIRRWFSPSVLRDSFSSVLLHFLPCPFGWSLPLNVDWNPGLLLPLPDARSGYLSLLQFLSPFLLLSLPLSLSLKGKVQRAVKPSYSAAFKDGRNPGVDLRAASTALHSWCLTLLGNQILLWEFIVPRFVFSELLVIGP